MILDAMAYIPVAQLLGFVAGGLVLNVAPGQDVFFASACGVQGGPRAGALAGLGVGLGVLFHLALATAGLGALIAAHPDALLAIKYAGAGYLAWLAWKSWRAPPPDPTTRQAARRPWNIIRRAALSNILNPKPVLFLLAFLPQFTNPAHGPVWQQILGLGLIFAATSTVVTVGYGVLAGWLGLRLGSRMGLMNRLAAVMFAGLALKLVTE